MENGCPIMEKACPFSMIGRPFMENGGTKRLIGRAFKVKGATKRLIGRVLNEAAPRRGFDVKLRRVRLRCWPRGGVKRSPDLRVMPATRGPWTTVT